MIRRGFLFLFAALLLTGCDQAPSPQPAAAPALWEVKDARGDTSGWLFGTIHALPDGASWMTPAFDRVISQAGVLVVEIRDLDPDRLAREFERRARDRPAPPLAERLNPAARRDLIALLAREQTPARRLDGLETWAAALAVAQLGASMKPDNGADRALLTRFANRPVAELEGVADQLAAFDTLPERDQRAMLVAVIAESANASDNAAMLARAWSSGDTDLMYRLARTGLLAEPALYEALLARRNRAWAARVIPLIATGARPLVAVGAAHLLGPDGLPALLVQRGYTVTRIQ